MNSMKSVKTASSKSSFLDKAIRYVLDTDSQPDQCRAEIFLMGVNHPGYSDPSDNATDPRCQDSTNQWPSQFYADFRSRIWCTYRRDFEPILGRWTSDSGYGCMIRTGQSLLANALLTIHVGRDWRRPPCPPPIRSPSSFFPPSPKNTQRRRSSVHSSPPPASASFSPTTTSNSSSSDNHDRSRSRHAAYVRLLTWFFDSPAPDAPFSVHRMALAGKDLGTEVGQWFGPSIAAGAIKTLVQRFPACGLGVSVAVDGVLYQSSVFEASHTSPLSDDVEPGSFSWGDRPVLLLLGLRLGLDGVNPIYYDTIKQLYTFPQSVGIAGGRPSSSYYFVGAQAEGLFYLDPHHSRPAIPLRPPMIATSKELDDAAEQYFASAYTTAELQTFHCEKVRKMPISGLDPSMLVGFLCRDADEWADFRKRVLDLPRPIFMVQDEPPAWPTIDLGGDDDDDALALESLSSEDASTAPVQPLTPKAANSALTPLDTMVVGASSATSPDETYSPIGVPATPSRVNSEDSARFSSNGLGKTPRMFTMEGLRNKLRSFGRSRTSLALMDGEEK